MNRMFTTCPGCRMNLAVTAPDLRVGQGYVRCGRCERVFNALLTLSDELDPTEDSSSRATGTTTVPALDAGTETAPGEELQDGDAADEDADEDAGSTEDSDEDADEEEAPAEMPAPQNTGSHPAMPQPAGVDVFDSQATGSYETIVLEGETFLQTEEHVDVAEIDQQIEQIARQIGTAPAQASADQPDIIDAPLLHGADPLFGKPRAHWGWTVAALLLALLLAGQLVHHNRQALVAQPALQRPMQAVYGLFGTTLEPAWDLQAYDLRQLGAEAQESSTTILLRATVQNLATHAQPPPLIRAVLQDRYGNTISTVAVLPQDYARGTAPARLEPQQRLDAELQLPDPQGQAVSFQLDVCLPAADATLHCGGEP